MASETDEWDDPPADEPDGSAAGFALFGALLVLWAGALSILGHHMLAFGYMTLLTVFVGTFVIAAALTSGGEE